MNAPSWAGSCFVHIGSSLSGPETLSMVVVEVADGQLEIALFQGREERPGLGRQGVVGPAWGLGPGGRRARAKSSEGGARDSGRFFIMHWAII
ncbi:MAG: hypothetical protein MZV64_50050 [Ignavibacteriales bacterium]|nr:hypothetical protein [Ignavibacteriales bacterium]